MAAIADKHKLHHKDLGGSLYVDLDWPEQIQEARQALESEPGIELVFRARKRAGGSVCCRSGQEICSCWRTAIRPLERFRVGA